MSKKTKNILITIGVGLALFASFAAVIIGIKSALTANVETQGASVVVLIVMIAVLILVSVVCAMFATLSYLEKVDELNALSKRFSNLLHIHLENHELKAELRELKEEQKESGKGKSK